MAPLLALYDDKPENITKYSGAVIGSVIGGLLALGLILYCWLCVRHAIQEQAIVDEEEVAREVERWHSIGIRRGRRSLSTRPSMSQQRSSMSMRRSMSSGLPTS